MSLYLVTSACGWFRQTIRATSADDARYAARNVPGKPSTHKVSRIA